MKTKKKANYKEIEINLYFDGSYELGQSGYNHTCDCECKCGCAEGECECGDCDDCHEKEVASFEKACGDTADEANKHLEKYNICIDASLATIHRPFVTAKRDYGMWQSIIDSISYDEDSQEYESGCGETLARALVDQIYPEANER